MAGARRTLSALRGVHPRAERHLDRGKLHLQGRFLSFPRLHPETQADPAAAPEIFQGGSSRAARDMASRVSDWYFTNGNSIDGIRAQVEDIRAKAAANGHSVKVGVNAFIIARDTEEEARAVLDEIIAKADYEAVNAFGDAVKQAGKASPEGDGNWAKSTFEDLVQYNDGFKTNRSARHGRSPSASSR
ncbi:LLM class flavin-dependent oxidoreductase [Pseudomonas aeruginosa]|nr:LLM class flavin-dependent oxidoreductase [Pseudomonas aeruginosa]